MLKLNLHRTNKQQIKYLYDFLTLLAAKDIMLDYYEFADNIEISGGEYTTTVFKFNTQFEYSEIRKFNSLFTVSNPRLDSLSIRDLSIRESKRSIE